MSATTISGRNTTGDKQATTRQLAFANEIIERVCAMIAVRVDEVIGHRRVGRPRGSVLAANTARSLIYRASVEACIPARVMADAMNVSKREARRNQAAWEWRIAERRAEEAVRSMNQVGPYSPSLQSSARPEAPKQ